MFLKRKEISVTLIILDSSVVLSVDLLLLYQF